MDRIIQEFEPSLRLFDVVIPRLDVERYLTQLSAAEAPPAPLRDLWDWWEKCIADRTAIRKEEGEALAAYLEEVQLCLWGVSEEGLQPIQESEHERYATLMNAAIELFVCWTTEYVAKDVEPLAWIVAASKDQYSTLASSAGGFFAWCERKMFECEARTDDRMLCTPLALANYLVLTGMNDERASDAVRRISPCFRKDQEAWREKQRLLCRNPDPDPSIATILALESTRGCREFARAIDLIVQPSMPHSSELAQALHDMQFYGRDNEMGRMGFFEMFREF